MADALRPEICVIGGGPAGIAAARAAAAEGVSVVLVEKKALGGLNLAGGAIPLAALMAAASLHEALRRGPSLGISGAPLQINLAKVRDHVAGAVATVAAGISREHLIAEGISVINGRARFIDALTIAAGEATVRPRWVILAVGARPATPSLPGLDNVEHLAAPDAFELNRKIAHLIVVGASPEGLALAQAYQRLGIDATIVDEGPLLADEDAEAIDLLKTRLVREGVRLRTGVKVERITRRRGGIRVALNDPTEGDVTVDGSHLFLAGGRKAATDGLGLEAAGIGHDDAGIVVDGFRTSNRRVFAIGDAVEGPGSVVRAEQEGRAVVQAILFRRNARPDPAMGPWTTMTDPSYARVGQTEAAARRDSKEVRVWRFPFAETPRAIADKVPEGFLKVVATGNGRVLGAAALGRDASEHIALWSLAIGRGLPLSAMAELVAAYPSRVDAARSLALAAAGPRLTRPWRKRIIALLGKFG